jgi:hypothetical protein
MRRFAPEKRFWIPGQARNDEALGCSPGVGFGFVRWNLFLYFAALRVGEVVGRMIIRPYTCRT